MFDIEKICDLQAQMFQDIPATQGVDKELLKSILNQENDLLSASIYLYSAKIAYEIIHKKPFKSFNKRVALTIISLALNRNQLEFTANSTEQLYLLSEIESGNMSVARISAFISSKSKPL